MLSLHGYKDIIEIIQDRQSDQKPYNRRDIRHQSGAIINHQTIKNAIASTIATPRRHRNNASNNERFDKKNKLTYLVFQICNVLDETATLTMVSGT